tara:strand:+ start:2193 stop:2591 length:399 start_codon:yes stop_codon:yes gene_type:complete
MTSNKIFLYTFFAIIATFLNLITQRFIISFSQSNLFYLIAIFCGTVVGLLIKFFLDKKWIFFDKTSGLILQSRKFSKYSLMGILPTLIFWSTETIFWFLWNTENMREIGASIGLSIGYIIKYKLDKRFVFNK